MERGKNAMRDSKEIDRLKGIISDMSLMTGMLRGLIFAFQDEFNQHQHDTLTRIDKQIELLFYTSHFKQNIVNQP